MRMKLDQSDAVSESSMEKIQQDEILPAEYTEGINSPDVVVLPFGNHPYSMGDQESNLQCYPPPFDSKLTLESSLNEDNYIGLQHELLCIEEMAQCNLLAEYNIQTVLKVTDRYLLTPDPVCKAKYSTNGELFANIKLSTVLSGDSASGRLVLSNCTAVLLAPASTKGEECRKFYEAIIEDRGKTAIYIRLSKQCCEDLNLHSDQVFHAEMQFQLNRAPMCDMHFALERFQPSLVFPNARINLPLKVDPETFSPELKLNPEQKRAVLAITAPKASCLPPVLIIGPFGTGKTYTLAQAVRMLLDQKESRILVCTHSNSAADVYIREYLHPTVSEGRLEATPLRIYYRHRWVGTVHPTVQQYCLIDGKDKRFRVPTVEDVEKHKVVVTTLKSSKYLAQLNLDKGYFTHILIDEAAQALECEAIMPLSLADENTRIVLAGDHKQLNPEVYSDYAKKRNLHISLLERLYDLYPEDSICKIMLCENYRSHEAIIQYTSELFYDNHLTASGLQPRHEKYFPLTFFATRGEDDQHSNSTAFHNNAEVNEIVARIIELKSNWPEHWGDQDETSIGVVSPYYDQVVKIRAELRKKKLHDVSVESVLNVQGKQYKAIFISTVRTWKTCEASWDSGLDHGFLSNERLLNTAITRAKSLVAVVGDPVSLCSVGKCQKLWDKFILRCHVEQSLFGLTWCSLQSELAYMNLRSFPLNHLAPEFIPKMKGRPIKGRRYDQPPFPCQLSSPPFAPTLTAAHPVPVRPRRAIRGRRYEQPPPTTINKQIDDFTMKSRCP